MEKFFAAREADKWASKKPLKQPNWKKKYNKQFQAAFAECQNIIHENALIFLNLGLLYQDFHDACWGGKTAHRLNSALNILPQFFKIFMPETMQQK